MPLRASRGIELSQYEVGDFNGLDTLSAPEAVPQNYSPTCQNIAFTGFGKRANSRPGTSNFFDTTKGTDIDHMEMYTQPSPFTKFYLTLQSDHKLYYSKSGAASVLLFDASGFSTPPVHFQIAPYGNFVFIAFSDGFSGVSAIYVWDPTQLPTVQVDLCTVAPAAIGSFAAADGAAGSVTVGTHLLKVLFVTRTGFFSAPTSGTLSYVAPGSKKINLTNIPVHSDPQVSDRWIVMTAAGLGTYYKVVAVGDNSTTSLTIDISDAQLITQTDVTNYFLYTSPLPGASALKIYHERMIMTGDGSNSSLAYISEPGFPQTFRSDVGFLQLQREDGQRLVTTAIIRDILYFFKERSFFGVEDNGSDPKTWSPMVISKQVGTQSICGVSDESDEGWVIIQDPKGQYRFTGSQPQKISDTITPTWLTLNYSALATGRVIIDTVNKRILNLVPTGVNTRPDTILMMDYREGWKKPKWAPWVTAGTAWRDILQDGSQTMIASASSVIRQFDSSAISDNTSAINWFFRTEAIWSESDGMTYYDGCYIRAVGAGSLNLTVYNTEGTLIATPTALTLAAAPVADFYRGFNFTEERLFFQIGQNDASSWANVDHLIFEIGPDGVRPS